MSTEEDKSKELPSFIEAIAGEVENGYWKPQTLEEWTAYQQTSAFVTVWVKQQDQERSLRKMIGIWVFVLITFQVLGVFGLVALDACKLITINTEIVKFLIPSVLGEVFGMGFIVVKYLFKRTSNNPFVRISTGKEI